jgi:hypothetical protein
MKTEIYECDKCHKKATTADEIKLLDLGSIHVGFERQYRSGGEYDVYAAHQMWSKELCRACRAEIGCLESKVRSEAKAETNNIPTLEDMVREIVRQEINP